MDRAAIRILLGGLQVHSPVFFLVHRDKRIFALLVENMLLIPFPIGLHEGHDCLNLRIQEKRSQRLDKNGQLSCATAFITASGSPDSNLPLPNHSWQPHTAASSQQHLAESVPLSPTVVDIPADGRLHVVTKVGPVCQRGPRSDPGPGAVKHTPPRVPTPCTQRVAITLAPPPPLLSPPRGAATSAAAIAATAAAALARPIPVHRRVPVHPHRPKAAAFRL